MPKAHIKVVCTIGPASWDKEVVEKMVGAGMTCARVNGAFAGPNDLDKIANCVRSISPKVSLMIDVKGPEIRLNKFDEAIPLNNGDEIVIGNTSSEPIYPANYKDVYTFLKPGQRILIGDGDTELKVKEIVGDKIITTVTFGRLLKPGKAVNFPGLNYITSVLTDKDRENLDHAIKTGWDFVSPSFIQNKKGVEEVRNFITERGSDMKIIAKIEDEDGIRNIDEILEVVDGIMVARGGLGVSLGLKKVPLAQKMIIEKCNKIGKPVIVATQMLESMIENEQPTRGEVSDVATAILQGADCCMSSAETTIGKFPVRIVETFIEVAQEVEPSIETQIVSEKSYTDSVTDAITKAAAEMCRNLEESIQAVVVYTVTGASAHLIARHGVHQPIYVLTPQEKTIRRLSLSRGIVDSFLFAPEDIHVSDRDDALHAIAKAVEKNGIAKKGEKVLIISRGHKKKNVFASIFELLEI